MKFDVETGAEVRYRFDDGVFASETAFAPRVGATAEDDGYLVTLVTDMNEDRSECLVFAATDLAAGPDRETRPPRTHLERHARLLGTRGLTPSSVANHEAV